MNAFLDAIACAMLEALSAGETERDKIVVYVRKRLRGIEITEDHLSDAAERLTAALQERTAADRLAQPAVEGVDVGSAAYG